MLAEMSITYGILPSQLKDQLTTYDIRTVSEYNHYKGEKERWRE